MFAAVLLCWGGTAHADDPPGTTTGSGAGSDTAAAQRVAALKKFVADKADDPAFASHEGPDGECLVDTNRHVATLTFSADGVQHCKLTEVGEGYKLDIWILTVKGIYDTGTHYRVVAKPGDTIKDVLVHGSADDVKNAISILSGLGEAPSEVAWWHDPAQLGPYHFDSVTLTITLDEAGVSADTKLAVAPLYTFNLAVVAVGGPGVPSFAVSGGKIAENPSSASLDYYFGVHFYPLSWERNGNGKLRPARYFSDRFRSSSDPFSIVLGVNLAHPTQSGFIGVAVEVVDGIAVTAGWQPRKVDELVGTSVGAASTGDTAPTSSKWKLDNWGVGLSLDATLIKPLVSVFSGK